jgi:hypothetical protein
LGRGGLFGAADFFQQVDQLGDFHFGHVGELAAVHVDNRLIEFLENAGSFGGESCGNDAAVLGVAVAGDEVAGLEAVEEAGDVGVAGDEMFADAFAGHAAVAGAAEDAKDVVLGGGEVVGFEEFLETAGDVVGGADQVEEEFLLHALERSNLVELFLEFTAHADTIVVATSKSKSGRENGLEERG